MYCIGKAKHSTIAARCKGDCFHSASPVLHGKKNLEASRYFPANCCSATHFDRYNEKYKWDNVGLGKGNCNVRTGPWETNYFCKLFKNLILSNLVLPFKWCKFTETPFFTFAMQLCLTECKAKKLGPPIDRKAKMCQLSGAMQCGLCA